MNDPVRVAVSGAAGQIGYSPEVAPERRVAHWRLPGLRRSDQQSSS
ncbi:MAG: hypothetical protein OXB92_06220 [Acidimicrobiaceae bacterium]|nr:hypothetical protein [Acidimicrobiia bacterium]MCY4493433.1 hypothetical protein [Acidimicrobiaceae bacterium]